MTIPRPAVWALLGTLGVLTIVALPDLGSGAWPFAPTERRSPRRARTARPRRRRGVGSRRSAHRRHDRGAHRRARRRRRLASGSLAARVGDRSLRRRRLAARRARGAAAGRAPRRDRALVPRERLDVPDRDRRRPRPRRRQPVRTRLPGHAGSNAGTRRQERAAAGRSPSTTSRTSRAPCSPPRRGALLPAPFDDYRLLVLLATLALLPAALLFPGPFEWRLAVGTALAANPLAIKAVWFGTADAPSVLCLVLAFALAVRSRWVWAAVLLAPRGAAEAVRARRAALPGRDVHRPRRVPDNRRSRRCRVRRRAARRRAPVPDRRPGRAVGRHDRLRSRHLPDRRVRALGASRPGRRDRRPVRPLPVRAPRAARLGPGDGLARSGDSSARASSGRAAAGFSISMFVLLFLGRVFQTSYLVWPLAGIAVAYLLAAGERDEAA